MSVTCVETVIHGDVWRIPSAACLVKTLRTIFCTGVTLKILVNIAHHMSAFTRSSSFISGYFNLLNISEQI